MIAPTLPLFDPDTEAEMFPARPPETPRILPLPERAGARRSDPETSHQAASAASVDIKESQRCVLRVYRWRGRAMLDEELIAAYADARTSWPDLMEQSESGIRSRRCELERAGYLEKTGERRRTPGGNPTNEFQLTPKGRTETI